jgi:hypothetical protein
MIELFQSESCLRAKRLESNPIYSLAPIHDTSSWRGAYYLDSESLELQGLALSGLSPGLVNQMDGASSLTSFMVRPTCECLDIRLCDGL